MTFQRLWDENQYICRLIEKGEPHGLERHNAAPARVAGQGQTVMAAMKPVAQEEPYIASIVVLARERELMARLDNLEGCEDNPVYASEVQKIRKELAAIRHTVEVREDGQGVTHCGAAMRKDLGYNIYAPQSALDTPAEQAVRTDGG